MIGTLYNKIYYVTIPKKLKIKMKAGLNMTSNNKDNKLQSIHLRLDKKFVEEIDHFSKEHRFHTRTDAIRFLLSSGLKYQQTADKLIERKPESND